MQMEVLHLAKTVSLPEAVYADLVSVSDELTKMAKKPISLSMAVYLLTEVYRAHLSEPCARDLFRKKLASSDLMTPQEFDQACEEMPPKPKAVSTK